MKITLKYSDLDNLFNDVEKEEFIARLNVCDKETRAAWEIINYLIEFGKVKSFWQILDDRLKNEIFERIKLLTADGKNKLLCSECFGQGIIPQDHLFYIPCSICSKKGYI